MNTIKPDWPLPPHVHAAVTLRAGGVSVGNYSSLNPATHVGDNPEHVERNRLIIETSLNLPSEPVWLQQVHGDHVVKADQVRTVPEADASYTDRKNFVCAVLTADCLPVLFCGAQGEVIAAAHAGWKGLHAGILKKTVEAMHCRDISAWFGPAIGPKQFEVGDEVYQAFVDLDKQMATAFKAVKPGKWLADIYQLARIQLQSLAIRHIYGGHYCTVSDPQRFYSYRRDGAATGRMASLIWRS